LKSEKRKGKVDAERRRFIFFPNEKVRVKIYTTVVVLFNRDYCAPGGCRQPASYPPFAKSTGQ
jgi:hypothetical protein